MGYECKIFIVDVTRWKPENQSEQVYAEIIATMKMCRMDYSFYKLFTEEIDYEIYAEDGNHTTSRDRYGDKIKSAKIDKVIEWLESEIERDNYRRLKPFLGLLKGFNPDMWNDLQILHYGY